MADPILWPEINYFCTRDSWTLVLTDNASKSSTEMDNGQTLTRLRNTKTISPITLAIEFTGQELAIFIYFFKKILKDGSLWFQMPVFTGQSYTICMVRFSTGDSSPQAKEVGYDTYEVSLPLSIYELPLVSSDVYDYFSMLGSVYSETFGDEVTKFTNDVYPDITTGNNDDDSY